MSSIHLTKTQGKLVIIGVCVAVTIIGVLLFLDYENGIQKQKLISGETMLFKNTLEYYDYEIKHSQTSNPFANKILSQCGTDEHCTVESFQDLARKQDSDQVLMAVSNVTYVYDKMQFVCHRQGHHIGEFLLGYTGGNVSQALLLADRKCGGALFHGIVENYFKSKLVFASDQDYELGISEVCSIFYSDEYSSVRFECTHGIGHGLAVSYNYDVFSAVKQCDNLTRALDQRACYMGVYMQNVVEHRATKGGMFDETDLLYPCDRTDTKYAHICYQYHSPYLLLKKNNSVEGAFQECDKITPEDFIRDCYYGIGMIMAGSFSDNHQNIISECEKGIIGYQVHCIEGSMGVLADQLGVDEGFKFCKAVPKTFKANCYNRLGQFVKSVYPTDNMIESSCSKAESEEYYSVCIKSEPEQLDTLRKI